MSPASIIVVDDEPDIREIVAEILSDEGHRVVAAENASSARRAMDEGDIDLALVDIWMPDTDGISLLKEWSERVGDLQVVMISGHGNVETAVEAIRLGAYDFLEKPLSTAKLLVTVDRALSDQRLRRENRQLRRRLEPVSRVIGSSPPMSALRERIERIAAASAWVLVTGEPGSGKEVAARHLHACSDRAAGPFVDVRLAATPAESVSVQLFGSVEGETIRVGRFEEAAGGTLFLDEVADLDLPTQTRLLSALEEGRFMRLGGQQTIGIDVRIVAATNQSLQRAVAEGRFREDLYYRLNELPLAIPPLREHAEDVPELVDYYLEWSAEREGLAPRSVAPRAMRALAEYGWPGNVRELRNVVQQLLILSREPVIEVAEVRAALGQTATTTAAAARPAGYELGLREAREQFEREYLTHHLQRAGGNIAEVAQAVGMERTHLYRKLKGLGIGLRSTKEGA